MRNGCIGWSPVSGRPDDDGFGRAGRGDAVGRQGVTHDAVIGLGVDVAVIDRDAGAAVVTLREGRAEAHDVIGLAAVLGVLQGDQQAARGRRIVVVVPATPGVGIDDSVRCDHHVADVAEVVGEDGGAEARGQGDAAAVPLAGVWLGLVRLGRLAVRRDGGGEQQGCGEGGGGGE